MRPALERTRYLALLVLAALAVGNAIGYIADLHGPTRLWIDLGGVIVLVPISLLRERRRQGMGRL